MKKSITRKRLPQVKKKRYPKNLRRIYQGTNLYEQFEPSFTEAGLPSLARRARVPAHSATLLYNMYNMYKHFYLLLGYALLAVQPTYTRDPH